jgi:hypothetical protein
MFSRSLLPLALVVALPAMAHEGGHDMTPEQQAEMEAWMKAGTPGPAHQELAKKVGTYTAQVKSWQAPGTDPSIEQGTAKRRMMLDGRVMTEKFSSTMMGQPFRGHSMTGFDNVTGKYWSTWNDNMTTGLMTSEGSCDAKQTCTFTGSWVEPVSKQEVTSRMVSRWTSPTTEVFEMYAPGPDGKEFLMMEITYTKQP